MRFPCTCGLAKSGRISSKRMPGEGKSGNWRRDFLIRVLRRGSSVALGAVGAESRTGGLFEVASGADVGGWEEVDEWDMMRECGRNGGRYR